MSNTALIESLRLTAEATLRPLLRGHGPVALVDVPNYPNVGDSAIYLGELACLRSLGVGRPRYACDLRSYHPGHLAASVGRGPILLAGGGSLGDLWPLAQQCREAVIADFPDNPIVQLPQTIHFQSSSALRRARRVFDAHPNLTLLVRDRRSLEIARSEFRAPSLLCPDLAFCLGPLAAPGPPTRPVVWLSRTDSESRTPAPGAARALSVDWLDEPATLLRSLSYALINAVRRPRSGRLARPLLSAIYRPLARQRLLRGCRLLGSARCVITDRLHGHILSLLLGIPHVLLDNSYGKVSEFHRTWTEGSELVRWADSPEQALSAAWEMVEAPAAGRAAQSRVCLPAG
jgi:exopolysaccharide biosynthesis predicted pyruvyltransferase EpsI